eukprot:TRINITY_DN53044_c0_g1_i1.p3 TRINITY_DN53044_c0_g1~~TRINITY_DN53044_c0_g1_i1.p3  ORF type:complete len:101 (+),score=7.66 TRINITY_DN53044_c0_g1_i1:230-532(+)
MGVAPSRFQLYCFCCLWPVPHPSPPPAFIKPGSSNLRRFAPPAQDMTHTPPTAGVGWCCLAALSCSAHITHGDGGVFWLPRGVGMEAGPVQCCAERRCVG